MVMPIVSRVWDQELSFEEHWHYWKKITKALQKNNEIRPRTQPECQTLSKALGILRATISVATAVLNTLVIL